MRAWSPMNAEAMASEGRINVRSQAEEPGERITENENRHRENEHGKDHHPAVDPAVLLPGRQHAKRYGDRDRDDHGNHHQRDGGFNALLNLLRNRTPGIDGGAQVAAKNLQQPVAEAKQKRLIEVQGLADLLDILNRALLAGDDGRRVSRREVEQAEDEDGNHQHDGDGCQDTANNVGNHWAHIRSSRR